MRIIIFIDYDNLTDIQKAEGILSIATRAIIQIPEKIKLQRGTCEIRVYGGWYEGTEISPLAEKITAELQRDFPTIIKTQKNGSPSIQITSELAMSLLEDPGFHLVNTYRKKGRPSNLRVQQPVDVGCIHSTCLLPLAKKLLRNGSCPITNCSISSDDLVYRHEQKIVDTMLACDLVYAWNRQYDHLLLISGDDDFLPALRTALIRGASIVRYHPKPNRGRTLVAAGQYQLTEIEL